MYIFWPYFDMQNSRFLGGILLVVGTSIGGGMLALPLATAQAGFSGSLLFLILCWLVMLCGALLMLEVNLRLPPGSNLISMAKKTLGLPGQIIAWCFYLFMLYTLLSGYIAGGSDILQSLLQQVGLRITDQFTALVFTTLIAYVVARGIQTVDFVNRGFMFGKFIVLLVLFIIISPKVNTHTLSGGNIHAISGSLLILATSFGFASIVPSLRTYFEDDVLVLRRVIIIGSLIPLVCYILWEAVIMGLIEKEGPDGLVALSQSAHAASGLSHAVSLAVHNGFITMCFHFFAAVCMVTAFLGVSIGLFDFLADGLRLQKKGAQGRLVTMLTFLPPLLIVLCKPGIYIVSLAYAGFCCITLLLLLPALMSWRARSVSIGEDIAALVPGGRLVLSAIMSIAVWLLFLSWYPMR